MLHAGTKYILFSISEDFFGFQQIQSSSSMSISYYLPEKPDSFWGKKSFLCNVIRALDPHKLTHTHTHAHQSTTKPSLAREKAMLMFVVNLSSFIISIKLYAGNLCSVIQAEILIIQHRDQRRGNNFCSRNYTYCLGLVWNRSEWSSEVTINNDKSSAKVMKVDPVKIITRQESNWKLGPFQDHNYTIKIWFESTRNIIIDNPFRSNQASEQASKAKRVSGCWRWCWSQQERGVAKA